MSSTKSIAARVPMDDYLKFQKEAIRLKMSMSEYLIMKLYASEVKSKEEDESGELNPLRIDFHKTCLNISRRLSELSNSLSNELDATEVLDSAELENTIAKIDRIRMDIDEKGMEIRPYKTILPPEGY